MPLDRQLVIFSADAAQPSVSDLAGLLIGAAEVSKMGGTARVCVLVESAWRVHALAAEFGLRGLSISWAARPENHFWVRTSYSSALTSLPSPSFLDGARLRLWFIASGSLVDDAVILKLGNNHALARPALAPLGLDGSIERGPVVRIEGVGKLKRLADLIGPPPASAPPTAWP